MSIGALSKETMTQLRAHLIPLRVPTASHKDGAHLDDATDTVSFFQAMATILIANVATVTFVNCFAKIHAGDQEDRHICG